MNLNPAIARRGLNRRTDQNKPQDVYYHKGFAGPRVTNARARAMVDRRMRAATWAVYCAMPELFKGVTDEAMERFCRGTRAPVLVRDGFAVTTKHDGRVIDRQSLPAVMHPTALHQDAALAAAVRRNMVHIIRAYQYLSSRGQILAASRANDEHDRDTIAHERQNASANT